MTALILVEDDDFKARAATRIAARAGLEPVVRAVSLEEATELLQRFESERPKVLTDWQFPALTGGPPEDGMGRHVVALARELGLDVRVFSGRDVPEYGYADIWFDVQGINGLNEWLRH